MGVIEKRLILFFLAFVAAIQPARAGIFIEKGPFSVGQFPESIAIGDFNSDGHADLAVGLGSSASVAILLGNGDGTFGKAVNSAIGAPASSVVVADLDGDGKLDLATANGSDTSLTGNVSILIGKGDGTFQPAVSYGAGTQPLSLVVADLNHDGKLDLAVATDYLYPNSHADVLLGNGDGTFRNAVSYPVGFRPSAIAAGDLDHDGNLDLVVANYLSQNLSILLGNGDGTFQPQKQLRVGVGPTSLAIADLNGDGDLDVVVGIFDANGSHGGVNVLLGAGDGTFSSTKLYGSGYFVNFYSVALGDLNGDGILDLVTGDTLGVTILVGQGDGTFGPPRITYSLARPVPISVALGDLNGDAVPDIAAVGFDTGAAVILVNNWRGR